MRRAPLALGAGAAVVGLLLLGLTVGALREVPPRPRTGAVVGVPDVVGLPLGEARSATGRAGLVATVYERDPQAPGSIVVAQEPLGGTAARRGAIVGVGTQPASAATRPRGFWVVAGVVVALLLALALLVRLTVLAGTQRSADA